MENQPNENEGHMPLEDSLPAENLPSEVDHAPASSQVLVKAYENVGTVAVTQDQANILLAPIDPENDVDIHSYSGVPYVTWMRYVRRLNAAFGPMGWASVRVGQAQIEEGKDQKGNPYIDVEIRVALVVNGRLVRDAVGECRQSQGSRLSVAACLEGAMSSGIKRCCKSLGMFDELLDKRWAEVWIKQYAEQNQKGEWQRRKTISTSRTPAKTTAPAQAPPSGRQEGFVRKVTGPSDSGVWTLVIETLEGHITVFSRSALHGLDPEGIIGALVEFETKVVPQKDGNSFIGLNFFALKEE
jgi:hypothetical protein